jgi:hypothetical protein
MGDDFKSFAQLKNEFLSENKFSINIKNQDVEIKSNDGNDDNNKYKIGTIIFDEKTVDDINQELQGDEKDNMVLQKIYEELYQKAGKRKTRRNRKSKKGKKSRKARKSRRKSNRRRGRR